YKARLEALPPQQRKLIDELVRLGGAATPAEIAISTGLKPNLVATQLSRLRASSWLSVRRVRDKRSSAYVIKEQLFRIWYEMRYRAGTNRRSDFLVRFFQAFFKAE